MATVNPNATVILANNNATATEVSQESLGVILPKIFFGVFASFSIIGNLLVCWVFLRNKQLLRLASSIFIFGLAIVDISTGIIILSTPSILYSHIKLSVGSVNGELYCALVYSEYFLWTLGITSCYIIATLSIERLSMVGAPTNYKVFFTPRKAIIYVVLATIWGGILNGPNLYSDYYVRNSTKVVKCDLRPLPGGNILNRAIYFTIFTLRFALPLVVMVACYIAFMRKIKRSVSGISSTANLKTNARNRMMLRRLTRMSFLISVAFCVCWMPNQVYFALYAQRLVSYNYTFHIVTKILVVLNSAVNPIIYATSNKYFYNELGNIIKMILCCQSRRKHKLSLSPAKATG